MPPSACSKRPWRVVVRAGERAALVAEQFRFEQILGDRGGVDGDERLVGARAVAVQGTRHQFLAGAGFAVDQHGGVGLREAADGAEHFLHRRRLAEDLRRGLRLFGAAPVLALALLQRAADQFDRVVDVEGLGQVFERAALERGHRALQVGVGGHDDDRAGCGWRCCSCLQQIQPGAAGHADVADHHLRQVAGQRRQRLVGGCKTLELDLSRAPAPFPAPSGWSGRRR